RGKFMLLKLESLLLSIQQKKLTALDLTGTLIEDDSPQTNVMPSYHTYPSGHTSDKDCLQQLEIWHDGTIITCGIKDDYKMWRIVEDTELKEVPILENQLPDIQKFLSDTPKTFYEKGGSEMIWDKFQEQRYPYNAIKSLPLSKGVVKI